MQRAKDTFYMTVRDRIASLNPDRTVLLRGLLRPGVLVEENELAVEPQPLDVFCLRWGAVSLNNQEARPLATMRCEFHYSTAGNAGNGGMDRGRLMAAMDAELAAAINNAPQNIVKTDYAEATGPVAMRTRIFWGDVVFGALTVVGEQLRKVATVDVFSYQEAGER